MPLTEDQETQALGLLEKNAAAALVYINDKTSGFIHGLISGDTGSGERTYVFTVQNTLIPSLRRTAGAALVDEDQARQWIENANFAEETLKEVEGYAYQGTVGEILKATAVQTAQDVEDVAAKVEDVAAKVEDVAAKVVVPLSFGIGTGVALLVGLVLLFKFGGHRE